VALRTYWCVLTRKRLTSVKSRVVFDRVAGEFSSAMDLELAYTVQAAFRNGLKQIAGEDADPSDYRMNVYDAPGGVLSLPDFTAPADPGVYQGSGSLRDVADEMLIGELARRLRGQ